jgi:polysaccharide export outer membrane protein
MRNHSFLLLLFFFLLAGIIDARAEEKNSLLITPGDVLHILVANTPEMEQHARVTDQGTIPVIGVGDVPVVGLTPGQAAARLQEKFIASHYLRHPEVSITVESYAIAQVSVIGEVKTNGAFEINAPRPVLNVLALAGGLTPEANRHILIERNGDKGHPIPYFVSNNGESAIRDQIIVNPGDTVVVPRAGIVYVLGDVNRPGGFVMSNNESQLTFLQGIALAGGLAKSAKQGHAYLVRPTEGGGHQQMEIAVAKIQKGKLPDFPLQPGDVLYIPFSFGRNLAVNGSATIIGAAAQASVYAIP